MYGLAQSFRQKLAGIALSAFALGVGLWVLLGGEIKHSSDRTTCLSNLRQIGRAIAEYGSDYNGYFPLGGDPADLHSMVWRSDPVFWKYALKLKPLPEVLSPYAKNPLIWRCPADDGWTAGGANLPPAAQPSSYSEYGMSYQYRTELAFRHLSMASLTGYDYNAPQGRFGPPDINVLTDGSGRWHEHGAFQEYNGLMADGHVRTLRAQDYDMAWSIRVDPAMRRFGRGRGSFQVSPRPHYGVPPPP